MQQLAKKEIISGILLMLLGIWIWYTASGFPEMDDGYPGPSLFPILIAGGFILSGLGLIFLGQKIKEEPDEETPISTRRWIRFSLGAGLAVSIIYLMPYSGFLPGVCLYCIAIGLLMELQWYIAIITGVATSLVIYGIFNLLLGIQL